jgi:hypothetical protein
MQTPANFITHSGRQRLEWFRHTLDDEAELEELDRRAGHDYVPMDVYVDPAEREEHFSASAILKRLRRLQSLDERRHC